jgi:hypothetical protein
MSYWLRRHPGDVYVRFEVHYALWDGDRCWLAGHNARSDAPEPLEKLELVEGICQTVAVEDRLLEVTVGDRVAWSRLLLAPGTDVEGLARHVPVFSTMGDGVGFLGRVFRHRTGRLEAGPHVPIDDEVVQLCLPRLDGEAGLSAVRAALALTDPVPLASNGERLDVHLVSLIETNELAVRLAEGLIDLLLTREPARSQLREIERALEDQIPGDWDVSHQSQNRPYWVEDKSSPQYRLCSAIHGSRESEQRESAGVDEADAVQVQEGLFKEILEGGGELPSGLLTLGGVTLRRPPS